MMGNSNDMNGMMDMMAKMMGGDMNMGMPMMQDMMSTKLPQGLSMMLAKLPKEQRLDFAEKMIASMVEKGCEGLTAEEEKEFKKRLNNIINPKKKK